MKLTLPTVRLPVVVTLYPTYIKKRDNIITIISVSINLEREREEWNLYQTFEAN